MSHDPGEMRPAPIDWIPSAQLGQVHKRRPQIGRKKQLRAPKARGRNAHDGERMLVDLDSPAHHGAIAVEMSAPVIVAQDNEGYAVLPMLVGTMDKPPKVRLNAQRIEVVATDQVRPNDGWIPGAGVEPHRALNAIGNQRIEAAVAFEQVQIVGVRLRGSAFSFEGSLKHEKV